MVHKQKVRNTKKVRNSFLAGAVACGYLLFPATTATMLADDPKNVQLISDEESCTAGGSATFHVIYHNISGVKHANVVLKIKAPDGCDLDDGGLGDNKWVWDATSRILRCNLSNVDIDQVVVLDFKLKLKTTVTNGTAFQLSCVSQEDGKATYETPQVVIHSGTSIDQPFFIGYPDGRFHPSAFITRGETAAVVARIMNLSDDTPTKTYADVSGTSWDYRYITEVTNAGYMKGYPDRTFKPDSPITRAELVNLLLTIRGVQAVPLAGYSDTDKHWASDAIGTAKALNYVDGYGDGKFDPDDPTDRQSAAKWFDIALFRGQLMDGQTAVIQHFPDVPKTQWSFHWVEEGSVVAHESDQRNGYDYLVQYLPNQTRLN